MSELHCFDIYMPYRYRILGFSYRENSDSIFIHGLQEVCPPLICAFDSTQTSDNSAYYQTIVGLGMVAVSNWQSYMNFGIQEIFKILLRGFHNMRRQLAAGLPKAHST